MKLTIESLPAERLGCVQELMAYSVYEVYGCNIGIPPHGQAFEFTSLVRGHQVGRVDVIPAIDTDSDEVIGLAALWRSPCPTYAYLSMLYVLKTYRKKGVGSALLATVKRKYPNIRLSALPKEQPFYAAHGFRLGALNPRGDDMEFGDFICPSERFFPLVHPLDQMLEQWTERFEELKKDMARQIKRRT